MLANYLRTRLLALLRGAEERGWIDCYNPPWPPTPNGTGSRFDNGVYWIKLGKTGKGPGIWVADPDKLEGRPSTCRRLYGYLSPG